LAWNSVVRAGTLVAKIEELRPAMKVAALMSVISIQRS
jgi:hypothetical protein